MRTMLLDHHPPSPICTAQTTVSTWQRSVLMWLVVTSAILPAVGVPGEWPLQDTVKSAIAILALVGALLHAAWHLRRGSGRPPTVVYWHPVLGLPLVLAGYALASMAWGDAALAGAEAVRWCAVAVLMGLVWQACASDDCVDSCAAPLHLVMWGLHGGLVLASVWAVLQFTTGWRWFPQVASPASTFANRNFFAEYAVCALPYGVLLWAQLRQSGHRLLMGLSLAVVIAAVLMTGTRSALLALALEGAFLTCWIARNHHLALTRLRAPQRMFVLATVAVAIVALGLIPGSTGRPDSGLDTSSALQRSVERGASVVALDTTSPSSTITQRLDLWRASARMLQDHPWWGVGAGQWEVYIPLYFPPLTPLDTDYFAHNEAVQLLCEYGLPVGGLVLAIGLAVMLHSLPRLVTATLSWRATSGLAAWTSLAALGVVSLFGFPLHLAGCSWLAGLGMALVIGGTNSLRAAALRHTHAWIRWAMPVGIVVVATVSLVGVVQAVRAEAYLMQSIHITNGLLRIPRSDSDAREQAHQRAMLAAWEGIAIAPHYSKLITIAADNLARAGELRSALDLWEVVTESHPNYPLVWTSMVLAAMEVGEFDVALHAQTQLARLQPQSVYLTILRAIVLTRAARYDEASAVVRTLLAAGHQEPALLETCRALNRVLIADDRVRGCPSP